MDDTPLCRSGVSNRIWDLLKTDPEQFKAEVKKHFDLGYPGWTVVRADPNTKIVWIRDDRKKLL